MVLQVIKRQCAVQQEPLKQCRPWQYVHFRSNCGKGLKSRTVGPHVDVLLGSYSQLVGQIAADRLLDFSLQVPMQILAETCSASEPTCGHLLHLNFFDVSVF